MGHQKVFDILNSIQDNKKDLFADHSLAASEYSPYFVNRYLSSNMDTILYAQEMNQRPHLPPEMQYDYLRHVIRPRRRRCTWGKKIKIEHVDHVMLYFNCSRKDAIRALEVLTEEQLNRIIKACKTT